MDKKVIIKNFSKHAASYDDHAGIQEKCAEKLIGLLEGKYFAQILEIGCGTGIYTRLLRNKYPGAGITAVDISEEMVALARTKLQGANIDFAAADGERIASDKKFGLITSNASFQWFNDLDATIKLFSRTLTPGGVLSFSMYGPKTFTELNEVLMTYFDREHRLAASKFYSHGELKTIIGKYFSEYELKEECFTANFSSLRGLLLDIKRSGTRGEGLGGNVFLGKRAIHDMEKIYMNRFGGVAATHHVYFSRAVK